MPTSSICATTITFENEPFSHYIVSQVSYNVAIEVFCHVLDQILWVTQQSLSFRPKINQKQRAKLSVR